ncbi:MAG: hypothetical protein HZA93_26230 [Verrucomicrobia bacterium]|nr:hypothetical protein [Verrucomicrobiota bacterium]
MRNPRSNSGRWLNHEWKVGAAHPLYRKDGTFYMMLESFPGALFDERGYVVFKTKAELQACEHVRLYPGRITVTGGISTIPGYVQVR